MRCKAKSIRRCWSRVIARKWTRPHAVASLALGADTSKMRIRQEVLAVLKQLEIITTPPPEPPRRPHLKLVKPVEE
jgi:hypothetical protein